MKLVDAALAPSDDGRTTAVVDTPTVNTPTVNTPIVNTPTVTGVVLSMTSKKTSEETDQTEQTEKPTLAEAKVIQGTIHDLIARQEKVTFAEYLMQCLTDKANHDVMQWMPCGLQFTITNHRKFTMEHMHTLFKIRNMSSFVRKLTRWGFSRVHEKETGNSDIFRHSNFQRDQPELCKKIRCVNRAAMSNDAPSKLGSPLGMLPGSVIMGHLSEPPMHRNIISGDALDLHMVSPRPSMERGLPFLSNHSPSLFRYPERYHLHQTPNHTPHQAQRHAPRISPEYEKEMIGSTSFHSRQAPQVYSPPQIGRSMSAAAEYELEQVLLERQRARLYREQQHLQAAQQQQLYQRSRGVSPSVLSPPMASGSERSLGSMSERRYADSYPPAASTTSVVTAALESLQREGEYDLDMSPREAMLRAVLHKRQQQRAQQRAAASSGILKHSSAYPDMATPPPSRHPAYYR